MQVLLTKKGKDLVIFVKAGYVDTFRNLYPDKVQYSWWSFRFHSREKNIGWRIDYF
jgi:exodeoxyribonuclease-3